MSSARPGRTSRQFNSSWLMIALGPNAVHAQSFRLDLHVFDGGAAVSGTTPDGKPFSGSVTAHPLDGGASVVFRYNDGRERSCEARVALYSGTAIVVCR